MTLSRFFHFAALFLLFQAGVFNGCTRLHGKVASQPLDRYPELEGVQVLCVKRAWPTGKKQPQGYMALKLLGFPTNHESQSSMERDIYRNEIGILDPATGAWTTLYRPEGNAFVGHLNLHWDAEKLLFTQSGPENWKVYEIHLDGTGFRQVSDLPGDVDAYEPCYLPDGSILFSSNAPYQCVPCWHGVEEKFVANFYRMNADGSGVRRLCFDQDHDMHPSVRHNGQIIYSRWDYTGINRLFLRPLMTMNPDGTAQRAAYGSNSWFPNGLYYPKELPGQTGRFLCILAGYHGSNRSGTLAVVDLNQGTWEDRGIAMQISGTGNPIAYQYKDQLTVDVWPQYLTPTPLTDSVFLVSAFPQPKERKIGIYVADTQDRGTLLHEEEGFAFLEPLPLVKRKTPPVVPDRVDLDKTEATVYIQDIYTGPGLKGVPRGTVKDLRVIAYDFGYVGMAGNDKIGLSGPWEAMRILGTTPIEEDGSAMFEIPANTPVAFQPLDEEGKAVQLMRSWVTAMPGEVMSCVGCHESKRDAPRLRQTTASQSVPRKLDNWYGPARGFDFAREVQPVLNRYCVSCHDQDDSLDLRPEEDVPEYAGRKPGRLDFLRLHPEFAEKFDGKAIYTPAYEALLPYIRRVNIADDVSLLEPGEYHADTSELIQLLREGHFGVELDKESWSRLITWIDLNGPCHGTWNDVYNLPIPGEPNRRRWELAQLYGGPPVNPDVIPETKPYDETPVNFPLPVVDASGTSDRKTGMSPKIEYKSLDLGGGESIRLVRFGEGWWMAACETTNGQFRRFDPGHSSRYYGKRHADRGDDRGLSLDEDDQPALRVSWNRAMAFCRWLSERSGMTVTLPTVEQWERACRAGSPDDFHFTGDSFASWENLADRTFATFGYTGKSLDGHFVIGGDVDYIAAEGVDLADRRFDDGGCVTVPVGSYRANAFGLQDMHGNVAEWTLSGDGNGRKWVKGGSFLDRPSRAGASVARAYAPFFNVHNAGFRIAVLD